MWEICVLWIEAVCHLEAACCRDGMCAFECEEVTLALCHLKLLNLADVLASVLVLVDSDEFETYCIIEALLVDDVLNLVLAPGEDIALDQILFLLEGYDIDAVPA